MGTDDSKHTSGGVFVAVDSNEGAVVGAEEGVVVSIPGNEGRIAQAWWNAQGSLRVFSVYFWQSEGWTPRNEALLHAVVKQAEVTKDPWLIACDAHMCPEDVERSFWFQSGQKCMVVPKEASTRRSKGPKKVSGSKGVAASGEKSHR